MISSDLQNLAERIAEIERREHPGWRAVSGRTAWENLLLGGELEGGSLVELLSAEEGTGVWTLALFMAGHACGEGKILVVADSARRFYPPAAARHIDLRRTIVIRPKREQQALTAMTQALRCRAVGAALGKLERLSSTECRRLQGAAESGGGIGFVLRPVAALNMPSFAGARLLVTPVAEGSHAKSGSRCIQVEAVRFGGAGAPLLLEIDDEKGHVRVPASMAVAKSSASAPRAPG